MKSRRIEYFMYALLLSGAVFCSILTIIACAEEQRTLIVTWDQYENPEGIGIRLYQSRKPSVYNFNKEYAVADVSADVNEMSICIDLDTYNFVAIAYRRDDPNTISLPSNEVVIMDAFPPLKPNIKKKSLLRGCGL